MNRANRTLTGPLVVALVYDGLCTFEFSIVAEIFGLDRPEMGSAWYRFASVPIGRGPMRAHGGLTVLANGSVKLLDEADLIVVPGWTGIDVPVPKSLQSRLRRAWERGARLASICSGAFVLASTGLLDGRRATTHWRYANALAERHPTIDVDARVLYVDDQRLLTSAGSAAGIDLMMHIIRGDFGAAAANSVARRLVMPAHRSGGQAQYIQMPVPKDRNGELSTFLDKVRANLRQDWRIESMALEMGMSGRSFQRKFIQSTGATPARWLANVRIDEAKRLLETSRHPIERVADLTGFSSVQVLRVHFRKSVGITPSEYRDRFAVRA
jgi:AraC family transcriptional regulator, transcriptional activator FtrA